MAVERMRQVSLAPGEGGGFQKFAYPLTFRPECYTEGAFGIMVEEEPTEVEILIHNRETESYLRAQYPSVAALQAGPRRQDRAGDERAGYNRAAQLDTGLRPLARSLETAKAPQRNRGAAPRVRKELPCVSGSLTKILTAQMDELN